MQLKDIEITLNAFVGGGNYNTEESKTIENWETFRGLELEQTPVTGLDGDTITYNGVVYHVRKVTPTGLLWEVKGEGLRHRGRG